MSGAMSHLHAHEIDYRELIENSMVGVCRSKLSGEIVFANRAMAELMEFASVEEFVSQGILVRYKDSAQRADALRLLKEKGLLENYEATVLTRNGGEKIVLINVALKGEYLEGTLIDITERKIAAEQVRLSEASHTAILSAMPDLLFEVGLDGRYYAFHSPSTEMLVAPWEELRGKTISEYLPGEAAAVVMAALREAHEKGRSSGYQFDLQLPKGVSRFELSVARKALRDHEDPRFIVISRDITERRQAEAELGRYQDFLANVVNLTGEPVFVKDGTSRFTLVNDACCRLFGLKREEILGKTLAESLPADEMKHFLGVDKMVLETGEANTSEEKLTGADGKVHTLLTKKTRYIDPHGNRFVIGVIHNITERKNAEFLLERQAKMLDAIFAHCIDNFVILDKDYNFVRVSQSYADVCQRHIDDFVGKNHFELYPSPLKDEFDKAREQKVAYSRKARPFTFPDHPEWGVTYWDLGLVPLFDSHNDIEFFIFTLKDVTDVKNAELELRANQARLSEAQRISRLGSWELDLPTNELYWSDEIYRIFEVDAGKFSPSYEAFLGTIHPNDREAVNRAYLDSVENRKPYDITHRLKLADGRIKWVREQCQTFYDDSGKPVRSIGTVHDISEQKRSELAHQFAGAGTWDWDMANQNLIWSRELFQMFGLDPDSAAANFETWQAVIHPEDRDTAGQRIETAIRERRQLTNEYRVIHPNGAVRWISALGNAAYDHDGTPIHMTGICIDVTDKKLAEMELNRLYDELQAMQFALDQHSIVGTTDAKGVITYANDRFCQISGYSRDELIGKTHVIVKSDHHTRDFFKALWKTISRGQVWHGEICNRKKNGELYWVETTIVPVADQKTGKPTRYIGIRTDITEQKNYLESLNRSLYEKELLLAEVHHRVKNNLQVISSLISMQSHLIKDQQALVQLGSLSLRIRAMGLLHTKLYTSSDFGKVEVRDYLTAIIEQALSSGRRGAIPVEQNIDIDEIYLNIETSLPVGLIVNEIISNALKHAFDAVDKPWLQVRLKSAGRRLCLEICDNGPGVPENVDSSSSLGLRLIKVLVTQLHGTLVITYEAGACFRIDFEEQRKEEKRWMRTG